MRPLVFFIILALGSSVAGRRSVSPQPISTQPPLFTHVKNQVLQDPRTLFWGPNLQPPYPTNSWFTNMALGSMPVAQFPYLVRSYDNGFIACYPHVFTQAKSHTSTWRDEIVVSLPGIAKRQIISYDTLSVTQRWTGETSMVVKHLPGEPYITMNVTGPYFLLSSKFFQNNNSHLETGSIFELELKESSNDQEMQLWMLYSLTGNITLSVDTNHQIVVRLPSSSPFHVLRLAVVPSSTRTNAEVLTRYRKTVPSTGQIDLQFPSDTMSHVVHQYNPVDAYGTPTSDLLMLGLLNHLQTIDRSRAQFVLEEKYWTAKGPMTGIVASEWVLQEELIELDWQAPRPIDEQKIPAIQYVLKQDLNSGKSFVHQDNDTYSFGKWVGALARLVLIAEEIKDQDLLSQAVQKLRKELTPWIVRVYYRSTFLYDKTWGGLISANGWLTRGGDYGNGMYNDHHYHNGYYIYAAAVLLKHDPDWPWANRVIDLIRDIANPSQDDPFFPVTRHKDWFVGHSWAQGLDQTEDGKNQESTSEAINGYYGISLFGLATNNPYLRRLGKVLMATEIRATKLYWHMPQDSPIYPAPFSNNSIVGVLWSDKADYATFFGNNVEYIHCIQMLPFTPVSEFYLPKNWVREEYAVLSRALTRSSPILTEEWKAYIYEDWAIIDKQAAWTKAVNNLKDPAFRGGNSRTNVYWWIATRPE